MRYDKLAVIVAKYGMKLDIANPAWVDPALQEEPDKPERPAGPYLAPRSTFPSFVKIIEHNANRVFLAHGNLVPILDNLLKMARDLPQFLLLTRTRQEVVGITNIIADIMYEVKEEERSVEKIGTKAVELRELISSLMEHDQELQTHRFKFPQMQRFLDLSFSFLNSLVSIVNVPIYTEQLMY